MKGVVESLLNLVVMIKPRLLEKDLVNIYLVCPEKKKSPAFLSQTAYLSKLVGT